MNLKIFLLYFLFSCANYKISPSLKWNIIFYMVPTEDISPHAYYNTLTAASGYLKSHNVNAFFMCQGHLGFADKNETNFNTHAHEEATYYKLKKGSLFKLDFKDLHNGSELQSFKNFINFIFKNYESADHTALILSGHGTHLKSPKNGDSIFLVDNKRKGTKGFTFNDIEEANKYLKEKLNKKIDIVGLDACHMAYFELAYHLREYANYFIASQLEQNALGWNYEYIFNYLTKNFYITPRKLVEKIFSSYKDFYDFLIQKAPVEVDKKKNDTLSVVDLNKIEKFFKDLCKLEKSLNNQLSSPLDLRKELEKLKGEDKEKFLREFEELVIHNYKKNASSELGGLYITEDYFSSNCSDK